MSSGVTNTCFHPYTELRADYRFQLCHEVAEVKHIVTLITVIKHTRKLKTNSAQFVFVCACDVK